MSGQLFGQVADYLSQDGRGLSTVELDLNDLLSVIQNERRRHVIAILAQVDTETIEMGDLSERVAARQIGKAQSDVTSQERHRVYVGLKQTHLEQIEDAGLLEMVDRDAEFCATSETYAVAELIRELRAVTGGGL